MFNLLAQSVTDLPATPIGLIAFVVFQVSVLVGGIIKLQDIQKQNQRREIEAEAKRIEREDARETERERLMNARMEAMQEKMQALHDRQLQDRDSIIGRLEQRSDTQSKQIQELQLTNQDVVSKLAHVDAIAEERSKSITALEHKITIRDEELAKMKVVVELDRSRFEANEQIRRKEIEHLQAQIAELTLKVEENEKTNIVLARENEKLRMENTELHTLRKENDTLKHRIDENEKSYLAEKQDLIRRIEHLEERLVNDTA